MIEPLLQLQDRINNMGTIFKAILWDNSDRDIYYLRPITYLSPDENYGTPGWLQKNDSILITLPTGPVGVDGFTTIVLDPRWEVDGSFALTNTIKLQANLKEGQDHIDRDMVRCSNGLGTAAILPYRMSYSAIWVNDGWVIPDAEALR